MGLENPLHIAVLVVLLLLVFGAKRLPEIGRSLGSGMREFKDSITGDRPDSAPQQPALTQATPQPPPQEAPVAQPAATPAPAAPPAQAPAEPTRQA
ncbi:MAG: twin-arginine translocation protein TatA/E family subunit [Solirubrobacterales bacterium]|jgi:sec-independent protein translocase protein TatA|nr:twin-arginine translocation protein TatA/E family subunit [Solirubrobacterales bacterium]